MKFSTIKDILVAVAIIIFFIFIYKMYKNNIEIKRLSTNMEVLLNRDTNSSLLFKKEEFKDYLDNINSSLDSIIKSNNIKIKNINRVYKNNYIYNYDTTIIMYKFLQNDSIIGKIDYQPDSCIHLNATILKDSVKIDTLLIILAF